MKWQRSDRGAQRRRTVTLPIARGVDWRAIGYLFSIVGILLLGAKSMPKAGDPWWYWPALIGGVLTSIIGFGLRYLAHIKQRRQLAEIARKAEIN